MKVLSVSLSIPSAAQRIVCALLNGCDRRTVQPAGSTSSCTSARGLPIERVRGRHDAPAYAADYYDPAPLANRALRASHVRSEHGAAPVPGSGAGVAHGAVDDALRGAHESPPSGKLALGQAGGEGACASGAFGGLVQGVRVGHRRGGLGCASEDHVRDGGAVDGVVRRFEPTGLSEDDGEGYCAHAPPVGGSSSHACAINAASANMSVISATDAEHITSSSLVSPTCCALARRSLGRAR